MPVEKTAQAFRTIGEVAAELGVAQHVLRFWEKKFHQVRPVKRSGGRRYYRIEDIALLQEIRSLLHDQGYTIRGVQKLLRDGGLAKSVKSRATAPAETKRDTPAKALTSDNLRQAALPLDLLRDMTGLRQAAKAALDELESIRAELRQRLAS